MRKTLLLMLFLCARRGEGADPPVTNAVGVVDVPRQAVNEINSLNRLLYALAAERYAANSNRNQTWIMTVHEGGWLGKFTDGRYTVVSLPTLEPSDRIAVCRYAGQYNAFNLQSADAKAQAGKYHEARELYELTLRFDPCGGPLREEMEQKLACLRRLEKGEEPDKNLKRLRELHVDYTTGLDLVRIETAPVRVVRDLKELQLHR